MPEKEKPSGVWAVLRARLLSFGLILGLAFLLIVSLMVSAALAAFDSWFGGLLPGWEVLLQGAQRADLVRRSSTLLFAMIFKLMPTAPIAWRDVWIGAAVTAVLFELGKLLIGLYLGKSGVTEAFAAAGSLVVLVAWVYYAAQIFLLGAEFTKVYADEHGSLAGKRAAEPAVRGKSPSAEPQVGDARGVARLPEATDVPDYSGLSRTARAQQEVDRRVEVASGRLLRQLALLVAVTLAEVYVRRRAKRKRKEVRA